MARIALSEQEQTEGVLSEVHLAAATDALAADGYVVLSDAVARAPLARLKERMDADTRTLLAFQAEHGGNPRARGHLQQGPPPSPEFVTEAVTGNPFGDCHLEGRPR
ncbi:MAG: hypothetical protein U5O39_11985 [Gammaproteobacteria bacterium]|nr:hypothetical protein [Gammaproteobacteria bacterium]